MRKWRMSGVWQTQKLVLGLEDFSGHVGTCAEGFEGIHRGYAKEKRNAEERMLLNFCDQKKLCVARYKKKDKRKVTNSSGGNESIYEV